MAHIDPGQSLGVPTPTDPITGEPKTKPRVRPNRRGGMSQLRKEVNDDIDLVLWRNHLGEMHGPLGRFPFVTGTAWDTVEGLEAAHKRLHDEHDWGHSH